MGRRGLPALLERGARALFVGESPRLPSLGRRQSRGGIDARAHSVWILAASGVPRDRGGHGRNGSRSAPSGFGSGGLLTLLCGRQALTPALL